MYLQKEEIKSKIFKFYLEVFTIAAGRALASLSHAQWWRNYFIAEWLQGKPCIVSYLDISYSTQAVKSLMDCPVPQAVTYDPNWLALWTHRFGDPLLDAETFRLKPDSTLAKIGNKPKSVEEVQEQYMELLRFTPEG
jgi:hypothetical protein